MYVSFEDCAYMMSSCSPKPGRQQQRGSALAFRNCSKVSADPGTVPVISTDKRGSPIRSELCCWGSLPLNEVRPCSVWEMLVCLWMGFFARDTVADPVFRDRPVTVCLGIAGVTLEESKRRFSSAGRGVGTDASTCAKLVYFTSLVLYSFGRLESLSSSTVSQSAAGSALRWKGWSSSGLTKLVPWALCR